MVILPPSPPVSPSILMVSHHTEFPLNHSITLFLRTVKYSPPKTLHSPLCLPLLCPMSLFPEPSCIKTEGICVWFPSWCTGLNNILQNSDPLRPLKCDLIRKKRAFIDVIIQVLGEELILDLGRTPASNDCSPYKKGGAQRQYKDGDKWNNQGLLCTHGGRWNDPRGLPEALRPQKRQGRILPRDVS